MDIRCEGCGRVRSVPEDTLGDRGAKRRCECGATLVVFPKEHVAMASDAEPTTEDWSAGPLGKDVPEAVRTLFRGERVHPPGTAPPVQRKVAPGPPPVRTPRPPVPRAPDGLLSVTPPPPRAARGPLTPVGLLRTGSPSLDAPPPPRRLTGDPPPRREETPRAVPSAVEPIPPPALLDGALPIKTEPPPRMSPADRLSAQALKTAPPARERRAAAAAAITLPETDHGDIPSQPRDPATPAPQSQQVAAGLSYAAPWGAQQAPPGAPPPPTVQPQGPYSSSPPFAQAPSQGTYTPHPAPNHPGTPAPPAWTGTPAPPGWAWTPGHPDAHTGTPGPGLSYAPPWTHSPAPTHTGAPALVTTWQPQWVPAVVLGMELRTLASLLAVVAAVGFASSCAGVALSQLSAPYYVPTPVNRAVPGTTVPRVVSEPARAAEVPVSPPPPPTRIEDRPLPAAPTAIEREPPPPAAPSGGPPFEVDPNDVRDPWAP